jgi:uncharacterized protein YbjT (DUF2867 family)
MIVITGANGTLGRGIVERLLERVPAERVAVSVRDPAQAAPLAERGVEVRLGDYDDRAGLRAAFARADQVLVVSANRTGADALRLHRNAIQAASDAGARRILYTSHMGAGAGSAFAPMPDHAATEALLAATGVPSTSLRNGFYASTVLQLLGDAAQTGRLVAPEDGPVSWTAHADLAQAAAVMLTEPERFDGPTPPLTGAQALDLAAVAELLSDLWDREVTRVTVSDDAWRDGLVEHGVPAAQADMLVGMFVASRAGEFAATDPTLAKLLGRTPASVRDVLAAAT